MDKLNILISNVSYQASAGSFIKMLRNSKEYCYYIVGIDSIPMGFSSGSMLVDKFYHYPKEYNEQDYINFIKVVIDNEKIDLVISAEEEDLKLFKKYNITSSLYNNIPDYYIFDIFKDKHSANLKMKELNIPIPKYIYSYQDVQNSSHNLFIKRKRVSCCSRGIEIINKEKIQSNFKFFSNQYLTQEFIQGKIYTVDVFCDKSGNPLLIIPRQAISIKDGTVFKCIIEKNKHLIQLTQKIYSNYRIPGLSNIQFIIDNENQPYFIELNPRAAATCIASSLASFNFLDLYVKHFYNNKDLPNYNELMNCVHWNSVISRYYEETILIGEN